MPTVITPAELAARAAAVRAARENAAPRKRKGKRAAAPAPSLTPDERAEGNATPMHEAGPSRPEAAPAPVAGGKAKLIDTLSADALRVQIDALLNKLRTETNADAKKKIRRSLRLRGHRGGLSHERAAAAAETTPAEQA